MSRWTSAKKKHLLGCSYLCQHRRNLHKEKLSGLVQQKLSRSAIAPLFKFPLLMQEYDLPNNQLSAEWRQGCLLQVCGHRAEVPGCRLCLAEGMIHNSQSAFVMHGTK